MPRIDHIRSAFAGAASLLFAFLPSAALALGPDCVAPGSQVLTDAAGDQIGNTDTDMQSVSLSEASSTTRNLVFTVKTGISPGPMTPNGRWLVTFQANTPAKDYNVAMVTSPESNGGAPTFHYGSGLNTDGFAGSVELGRGLAGSSYDAATGTMRIVAPISAFGLSAGNEISTIKVDAKLSGGACGVACLNGASADTGTSTINYAVGAACGTLIATPAGGTNNSSPGPVYGGPDIAGPVDARYQVFAPPAGIGADGSAGEYSIGYNPATKRIMANSLGFSVGPIDVELFSTKVFRVTTPELLTPALPESCDALWEDKSNLYNNTPQVVSDPILWTDQDTGRTFSANLTTGANPTSQYAYTDDDGETWIPGGLGIAGADHQTVTSGFYPASSPFELIARNIGYGQKNADGDVVKGKAVYFCSQDLVPGTCIRSDDGGNTWTPPQVAYDGTLCSNLHGHLKIAPDGSAYLPIKGCGSAQGGTYTHNAGLTWTQFTVPDTTPQADGSDPSIAIDDANQLYYCYVNGDGRPRVRVGSKQGDGSLAWTTDTDLGSDHGILNATFPEAIGGDPGRASCGFLGTNAAGTNYQSRDFPGVWYLYIATTLDGGLTWTTVNATPNDPVQGVGGIWQQGGSGDTNNNRNLLDFNEVTLDEKGRVLFGYNDGCVGACDGNPVSSPTYVASMRVVRQTGGKTLRAAFDNALGAARAPGAACLSAADAGANVSLNWRRPDHGGAALLFDIEQVFNNGTSVTVAQTGNTAFTVPAKSLATSAFRVRAVNPTGSTLSAQFGTPGVAPVINRAPTSSLAVTPDEIVGSTAGTTVSFTVTMADADGNPLSYDLDFGDGSTHATGVAGGTVSHLYTGTEARVYSAVLRVLETSTSPALSAPLATASVNQTAAPTSAAITISDFTAVFADNADVSDGHAVVNFTVTASNSDPAGGNLSYSYNYGDGSAATGRLSSNTSSHDYTHLGNYTATVIVADDHGNSATRTVPVKTTNTVVVGPGPVTAQLAFGFEGGSSQIPATALLDGSGSTSYSGAIYRFSFGDGSADQVGTANTARHAYSTAGTYTITLTVTDNADASNTSTATGTLTTTALQQTVAQLTVNPSAVRVGDTVTFDASASIAKTGSSIASYTFDFGDGSTQTGSNPVVTHIYTTTGSFQPGVTVTDGTGGSSSSKSLVKVGAQPVTPPPAPTTGGAVSFGSSGGALPLWTLLPLLALAGVRRRRRVH